MRHTSSTGLLSSPKKQLVFPKKKVDIQLKAIAGPAPFVLKPFAGIYNPYPYGCSLLCNHPTDNEAKELLKRAKDTWATEGKSLLLAEEVAAIRAGLEKLQLAEHVPQRKLDVPLPVESVPEELFRRYTETDSRPLTPAPTLVSAHTRASGSRRCVTPDPVTSEVKEKTLLILDLRRSHSQETLSWQGSSVHHPEPPLIKIQHVPSNTTTPEPHLSQTPDASKKKSERNLQTPTGLPKRPRSAKQEVKPTQLQVTPPQEDEQLVEGEEEEEIDRRRGKKRRKKSRDSSRGPPAFQTSVDPETQVATIGLDSHNPSARPSLVPTSAGPDPGGITPLTPMLQSRNSLDVDSYLDKEILRQLRRELNDETVDSEFNLKRRLALQEALKTLTKSKMPCEELSNLKKEINLTPVSTELWLSLPRDFTRSSARFELPMDSRSLSKMTPLDYVKESVSISSSRKLIYNCVFNKHKIQHEDIEGMEREYDRKLAGTEIVNALNTMMGKDMVEKQVEYFRGLVGWSDSDEMDFKTFCGLCALCERLLAPEYCPQLPTKKADPCHEIETVDFEALERKLHGQKVDERLVKILHAIKES